MPARAIVVPFAVALDDFEQRCGGFRALAVGVERGREIESGLMIQRICGEFLFKLGYRADRSGLFGQASPPEPSSGSRPSATSPPAHPSPSPIPHRVERGGSIQYESALPALSSKGESSGSSGAASGSGSAASGTESSAAVETRESDVVEPELKMKMKACVDCHRVNHAAVTCTTCHENFQ